MRKPAVAAALLMLGAACAVSSRAPERTGRRPFDAGAPQEVGRPKSYHVRHYSLTVSFDEPAGELFASETIRFEPLGGPLSRLVLDAEGLELESARSDSGQPLPFETLPRAIAIDLGREIPPGTAGQVTIRYRAFPKRGLHFVRPDEADGNKTAQIWSQGEQSDSHFWFACRDEPDDLATSEIIGTVRSSETLISNGRLLGVEDHPQSGTRTFHWKIDQPHAAYLTSLVVGDFEELSEEREGVRLSYYVPRRVDRETALRSFGRTGDILGFFSRTFGVAYPYARYSQTAVEEFEGGMENVGATTFGEEILHLAGDEPEEKSDGLVAHELAHQWFGDMVTCRTWSEVWLNESFAEFAAGLWTEQSEGLEEYRYEMLQAERAFLEEDRESYRRPLLQKSYLDTADLFDHVTYEKGNWVLSMLRGLLGDRDFFRGLRIYLQDNAWGNVDTSALQLAMEKSAGRPLGAFFQEWVRSAGYPEYRVTYRYADAERRLHIEVDQTQTAADGTPVFSMPVDLDFDTDSGIETHRLELRVRHEEFQFPAARAPQLVRFDPENGVLKLVEFRKSREELARQSREDSDVAGRIWAIEQLSKRFADAKTADVLTGIASDDRFYGVRAAAATALGDFGDTSSAALRQRLTDPDSRVRSAAASALSACRRAGVFEDLSEALEKDASGSVAGAAAESIGKLQDGRSFGELRRALGLRREPAAWRGILSGFAELGTKESRAEVVRACSRGKPARFRRAAIAALSGFRKDRGAERSVLESLLEDPDLRIQTETVRTIGVLRLDHAVDALRRAARRSPMLREEVDSAIRRIAESKGKREEG